MTEQHISIETKRHLCDVLLRFEAMGDRDARNLYVTELELQLGQSLNVRRYADTKHDVWALVNACLTSSGALESFAQIVRSFHGSSSAMTELEHLVAEIERAGVLTGAERDTLIRMVAGTPPHQTAAAFLPLADPPGAATPDWSDARAVVGHLEATCGAGKGPLNLLRFAETVAHSGPPGLARELHQWVDGVGNRLGVGVTVLRALCRRARVAELSGNFGEELAADGDWTDTAVVSSVEAEAPEDCAGESMRTVTVVSRTVPETAEPPRIWGGPVPFRNPNFTGRGELLQKLHEHLTKHAKTSVLPQTLHGFGGVGKTQLAIEYAYQHAEQYNLIWWISADRPTEVLAALTELGARLDLPAGQDRQQTARAVLDALATSPYRWLLVYDNADKPGEIGPLVPSAGGHVILTSRNAEWTAQWHSIEVDVFEREESIELLSKRDTGIPAEVADRLADKLGDLPLALEQAANFQLATRMPTEEYLQLFDERLRELLDEGKPADYPTTVGAFLTLAFDNLRAAAPAAAELLDLFAFLGPDPIPAGLLHSGRQAELSPLLGEWLRDPIKMNRMIRELPRYGLARVDPKGQKIQVHRLVQTVLRAELHEERKIRTRENVRNLLAVANPSHPDSPDTWRVHADLGPHIRPSDLIHSGNSEARLVALDQARYLFKIGDNTASRDLAQAMVITWSKPRADGGLGRDNEQTVLAMRHLANALRLLGEYPESRRLDEEAYALLLANPDFGDDHEHTVHVAFGLGFDLNMAGDLVGALRSDQENLARAVRVYGPAHDYTLQAKGNVAGAERLLGHYQQAYELSLSIVLDLREMFGAADARTLSYVMDLACDLYGLGRYQEALETQSKAWDQVVQVFKPHQRERMLSERNIAIALRKTGDHAGAEALARKNHRDLHQYFGPDHEYTLAAGITYANALRATGKLAVARSTADTSIKGYQQVFGDRHRLTLAAQVNFGIIQRLLGERRTAHNLERDTFHALTADLGPEHPYTLSAASNYATSLLADHQVRESHELTSRTLEISRSIRGEEHPDTLACAVNAAINQQDAAAEPADQSTAQLRFDNVIDTLERVLGKEHPDTIDAIRGKRADCDIEPPPT